MGNGRMLKTNGHFGFGSIIISSYTHINKENISASLSRLFITISEEITNYQSVLIHLLITNRDSDKDKSTDLFCLF